eukprot:TRINITY_DN11242_c0_g1_i1.p1 TRINITY_DN11242_c0_g1~~TRINITY_DN11242_c0_g1_i1.p1  ORF type:complete len:192 (+),score=66.94 TRINITY_DN11242_c0_g1_i1:29-604(+)
MIEIRRSMIGKENKNQFEKVENIKNSDGIWFGEILNNHQSNGDSFDRSDEIISQSIGMRINYTLDNCNSIEREDIIIDEEDQKDVEFDQLFLDLKRDEEKEKEMKQEKELIKEKLEEEKESLNEFFLQMSQENKEPLSNFFCGATSLPMIYGINIDSFGQLNLPVAKETIFFQEKSYLEIEGEKIKITTRK